jgi:hypothetical protein
MRLPHSRHMKLRGLFLASLLDALRFDARSDIADRPFPARRLRLHATLASGYDDNVRIDEGVRL